MMGATRWIMVVAGLCLGAAAGTFFGRGTARRDATPPATGKSPPAAAVEKIINESEFNTVRLTELAEARLGLQVAPVAIQNLRRVRLYGGEIMIPSGRTILVTAPLGGTLRAPEAGLPAAGQAVEAGQSVLQLVPLLTSDGRATLAATLADVDGQVNSTKAQVDLARLTLDRAKRVLQGGAGSQRQVDEAQAAFEIASKSFDAAQGRQSILQKVIGEAEAGMVDPITIVAPESGVIRSITALPGQSVPAGTPLFEVIDLTTVWIRVPIPVGDLADIGPRLPAQVGPLSGRPATAFQPARPIAAPPTANPASLTVDVYYESSNPESRFIPGQRVGVAVPLADSESSPAVPWSAIVVDTHGGTWVYEQRAAHEFVRRRVDVRYTVDAEAVLSLGPAAGTTIVIAGSQQLFGAETGFIK